MAAREMAERGGGTGTGPDDVSARLAAHERKLNCLRRAVAGALLLVGVAMMAAMIDLSEGWRTAAALLLIVVVVGTGLPQWRADRRHGSGAWESGPGRPARGAPGRAA